MCLGLHHRQCLFLVLFCSTQSFLLVHRQSGGASNPHIDNLKDADANDSNETTDSGTGNGAGGSGTKASSNACSECVFSVCASTIVTYVLCLDLQDGHWPTVLTMRNRRQQTGCYIALSSRLLGLLVGTGIHQSFPGTSHSMISSHAYAGRKSGLNWYVFLLPSSHLGYISASGSCHVSRQLPREIASPIVQ